MKKARPAVRPRIDNIQANAIPEDWLNRLIPLWTSDTRLDSTESALAAVKRLSKKHYAKDSFIAEYTGDDYHVVLFEGGWWVGATPDGEEECGIVVKFPEGHNDRVMEELRRRTESRIHILSEGLALCGAGMPVDWPPEDRWISILDPEIPIEGLCEECEARK